MSTNPFELGINAWKRQIDVSLQIAEALVQGAEKAREIQAAAGAETHAWLEASRKAIAESPGVAELTAAESKLLTENMSKVAQYWSQLAANARDTQGRVFKVLVDGVGTAPLFTAGPQAHASQDALSIIDAGYKQWVDTLRSLYAPTSTH